MKVAWSLLDVAWPCCRAAAAGPSGGVRHAKKFKQPRRSPHAPGSQCETSLEYEYDYEPERRITSNIYDPEEFELEIATNP